MKPSSTSQGFSVIDKSKARSLLLAFLSCALLHAITFVDVGLGRNLSSEENRKDATQVKPTSNEDRVRRGRRPNGLLIPQHPDENPSKIISSTVNNVRNHFLSDCVPTSQYLIEVPRRKGLILLHSLGPDGQRKTEGGDEIYVTYFYNSNNSLSPNAVADVEDLKDGTYKLRFFKSRAPTLPRDQLFGTGSFKINLHYTCFAGHLDPPLKNTWVDSGVINTEYSSPSNVLPPPMRAPPNPKTYPDLANYETVYGVGNSLMRQFFMNGHISERPNFRYATTVRAPLNTQTVYEMLDTVRDIIERDTEEHNGKPSTNSALVLGSCVWDMLSIHSKESFDGINEGGFYELQDHLDAIKIYITTIQKEFPEWSLYWKGCTAIQVHSANFEGLLKRFCMYYASWTRGKILDQKQKQLMETLHVPVLDFWDISFQMSEFLQRDGRHHTQFFNTVAMNHFLGTSNELLY